MWMAIHLQYSWIRIKHHLISMMKIPTTCMVPAMYTHIIIEKCTKLSMKWGHITPIKCAWSRSVQSTPQKWGYHLSGRSPKWCSTLRLLVWHCSMWLIRWQEASCDNGVGMKSLLCSFSYMAYFCVLASNHMPWLKYLYIAIYMKRLPHPL